MNNNTIYSYTGQNIYLEMFMRRPWKVGPSYVLDRKWLYFILKRENGAEHVAITTPKYVLSGIASLLAEVFLILCLTTVLARYQ